MIAYNRHSLDNRQIKQEAAEALAKNVITEDEYQRILEAHPFKLYSPNIFIRIGLFLLTVLIVSCGLGILMLTDISANDHAIGARMILTGIMALVALELFIHNRGMYRAGVDDALLWTGTSLIYWGIEFSLGTFTDITSNGLVLILGVWGVWRYADRLMGLVAYGALLSLIFRSMTGSAAQNAAVPFIIMAISAVAYFLFSRMSRNESLRHYHSCLWLLRVAGLLSFYMAGNYFDIEHLNETVRSQSGPTAWVEGGPIALAWLWWTFTAIVPIVYIVWGIRKKDTVLLWTGLALVAAAVFTVRYYYHVLPTEAAMIIGGSILIATSYGLIRYLRTPKKGFTSAAPDEPHALENLPVEGLILAETFKSVSPQAVDQSNRFGGGSGGGAGAGGTY